jgi:hypothetical protein
MPRALTFGELPKVRNDLPVIVYDNRLLARSAGLTTVTADSEAVEGNFSASNLLDEWSFNKWRSGSVAARSLEPTPEIQLTFTLGDTPPEGIDWGSYGWSNNQCPWIRDYYDGDPDAAGVLLGSTGWMHPIVKATLADYEGLENPPLITGPTEREIEKMAVERQLSSFAHLPSRLYSVTHERWRFDVSSGTNGNDDFIQIAFAMSGRAFQPVLPLTSPPKLKPVRRSVRKDSASGVVSATERRTLIEKTFALPDMTAEQGQSRVFHDWILKQPDSARVLVYLQTCGEERARYYHGGAFIATVEAFDGVIIGKAPGAMSGYTINRDVPSIRLRETA